MNENQNSGLYLSNDIIIPVGKILMKKVNKVNKKNKVIKVNKVFMSLKQEDMAQVRHLIYSRGGKTIFFLDDEDIDIDKLLNSCKKDFVAEESDQEESENNNPEHNLNQSHGAYGYEY